ncbi:MAG: hypothetical protein M3321_12895, partial [Actinomycetota bacterium]|nr:hypothetical protein [Actinomycetota bacterium]
MRSRSYGLVADESGERLLLLRGPDGWELPRRDADEAASWHVVDGVNRDFGAVLGRDVTTLRCLSNTRVEGEGQVRFYELESHDSGEPPANAGWLDRDEVERAALAEPGQRATLIRC